MQRIYTTQLAADESQDFFFQLMHYQSATCFAVVRQRATDDNWYWMNPTAEYLVGLDQADLDKLDADWPCTLEEYQNDWVVEE